MKNIQLALLLSIFVTSCSKPDNVSGNVTPTPNPPQEQITIPSTVNVTPVVPAEGGEAKITFTAAAAWTASVISTKADSWVDVNPKSGNPGPAEIKIGTIPNDTYAERNATIQISCGGKTKDIVLTQKQLDNITVTTDKVELGEEGGTFTIELKSNIDFSYEIDGDWIKYVSTKAYTDKTLTFSAESNDGVQKREGSVTVKGGKFSETVKVYQSGGEPTLIISKNEYNLDAAGGDVTFTVTSSIGYKVTNNNPDWISEVSVKDGEKANSKVYTYSVAKNEQTKARTGIIVVCNDNQVCIPVTIKQAAAEEDVFSITPDKFDVDAIGGEVMFTVTSSIGYEVTNNNPDWISEVSVKDGETANSKVYTYSIAKNEQTKARTGIIVICNDNEVCIPVTVNQAGQPAEDVFLELGVYAIEFDHQEKCSEVKVTSNESWSAVSSDSWCTPVKIASGKYLNVCVKANDTGKKRTAQITVKTDRGGVKKTLTVSQSPQEGNEDFGDDGQIKWD